MTCTDVVKDPATGEIIELRCTYDPATRGGDAPDGRKVKATLHWVSAEHAVDAEVRLYDRLFNVEEPGARRRLPSTTSIPQSLEVLRGCKIEPSSPRRRAGRALSSSSAWATSAWIPTARAERPVFNRTVTLKDSWAKVEARS